MQDYNNNSAPHAEMQHPAIQNLSHDEFFLTIEWSSGYSSQFPLIFLRDNAPGTRHANGQKLIETATLNISPIPEKIIVSEDNGIVIKWEDNAKEDYFSADWFLMHDLTRSGSNYPQFLWDSQLNAQLPEGDFSTINKDEQALCDWLGYIQKFGFAILRNVPPVPGMITEVVKLFGYIRETNYGQIFDVKMIVNPGNLAYTGMAISAHTDNPYRNPAPTLQLLHCISSDAGGGNSVLADGFRITEDLREQYPGFFKVLTTVMVTYEYRDKENWLKHSAPIISLYPDGKLAAIRLNNRSVQPVKLPPGDLLEFYKAYQQFTRMTNDERYSVQFKMSPGDLYIVDNERITHARNAYDDKEGERWLQGAYADKDGLLSKWRILYDRYHNPPKL